MVFRDCAGQDIPTSAHGLRWDSGFPGGEDCLAISALPESGLIIRRSEVRVLPAPPSDLRFRLPGAGPAYFAGLPGDSLATHLFFCVMDEDEARRVLAQRLEPLRRLTYEQLVERFLNRTEAEEVVAESGNWYQFEIMGFWDGRRGGDLRILGYIDDGKGRRAFVPLADGFIMAPDGSFVGE